jgi:hypothetical protein
LKLAFLVKATRCFCVIVCICVCAGACVCVRVCVRVRVCELCLCVRVRVSACDCLYLVCHIYIYICSIYIWFLSTNCCNSYSQTAFLTASTFSTSAAIHIAHILFYSRLCVTAHTQHMTHITHMYTQAHTRTLYATLLQFPR